MFKPEACLFDLDGLLIDTEPLHGKAWSEAAKAFGENLSESQLKLLRGRRRSDCAKQISEWADKPLDIERLISIQQPIAKKLLSSASPMPGAESLIRCCRKYNLPIALVTSSTSASAALKCAPHPWLKLIETRVLGDDEMLFSGKPAPDPFLLAAKKLNVEPNKCWALEDSLAGAESAAKANCQVWILTNEEVNTETNNKNLQTSNKNPIRINQLSIVQETLQELFK